MIKIYHNNRCSKSRQTLSLLEGQSSKLEVVDYLKNPPTPDEIRSILDKLGVKPIDIIRKGETVFKENFKGKNLTDEEWINAMVSNPILIERPIVVKGDRAVIGRPPDNVNQLL